nr:hypothetical protein [uncultured Mediterranean phage uvMED]|tara:strand:- start:1190 stop:1417 length:228 start_codon:yes stop_codon:yes gene_type:complete
MKNIKSKLKYYLRALIFDFSTLDHNDYEREEELEIRLNEIIEVMLNNKIIDNDWCDLHSRHQEPHILYALLDKLK